MKFTSYLFVLVSVSVSYILLMLWSVILLRYMNKRHLVDVTEIFNLLGYEKKYRLMKLGFYLILFFIVIYK